MGRGKGEGTGGRKRVSALRVREMAAVRLVISKRLEASALALVGCTVLSRDGSHTSSNHSSKPWSRVAMLTATAPSCSAPTVRVRVWVRARARARVRVRVRVRGER